MIVRVRPKTVLLLSLTLLAFFSSCEKPEQRASTDPVEVLPQAPPPLAPPLAEAPRVEVPAPAENRPKVAPGTASADEKKTPEDPELHVSISGQRLIVRGALTSRIQQERILETLEREFPHLEMVKDLKLEYHRHPVGWGNRVADPFLVRFLKEVDDPVVHYEKGIVTLEGKPKSGTQVRSLSEMAIGTFSGDRTQDLVNKLVGVR